MKILMFYVKKMCTITTMNVLLFYKITVSTYWALAYIVSCNADNESLEQEKLVELPPVCLHNVYMPRKEEHVE